jgi:Abi-like protein
VDGRGHIRDTVGLYHIAEKKQERNDEKTSEYEKIWRDMQKGFSAPRLTPYTNTADDDEIDPLARYYWNMALSETLYPVLHCLEVVLRNAMHSALTSTQSRADWYDVPTLLRPYEQNKIAKAKRELTHNGKPTTPDRVIAELTFGFWTSLFIHHYDSSIAIPTIPRVFAHAPRRLRTRRAIQPILDDIRFLRNRVFHHEPIWYWGNLADKHQQILTTIDWISPPAKNLLVIIDRFDNVYSGGWKPYRDAIKYKILEDEEARKAASLPKI